MLRVVVGSWWRPLPNCVVDNVERYNFYTDLVKIRVLQVHYTFLAYRTHCQSSYMGLSTSRWHAVLLVE